MDTQQDERVPILVRRKRRKVFLWIFLAVQAIFIIWIVTGGNAAQHTNCSSLTAADCQSARDVGTTIGIGLIIFLWAAIDVILGISYGVYRLARKR